jgi:hypothetical protein
VRQSSALLAVYLAAVVAFFFLLGIAILNKELPYQFYADSVTYEDMAEGRFAGVLEGESLISASANYLGPVLLLKALNGSRVAVLTFNIVTFIVGLWLLCRFIVLDRRVLVAVLALNPMTFSSLLSVNKEILAYLSVCLLVAYLGSRHWRWLIPGLLLSVLARWQLTAFMIAAVLAYSPLNPVRRSPAKTLILALIALTLIYPQLGEVIETVSETAAAGALEGNQSGIFQQMVQLQSHYGYFLVVVPKTLQGMFGIIARIDNFADPDDFYNMVVVMLHSVTMAVLFVLVALTGRFRLR